MTRPLLTLKKPDEPAPATKKSAARAVDFLAGLGLPLFEHMQKTGVLVPMAVGIREEIIARVDPALHGKVRTALKRIARCPDYRYAVHVDGARRCNLDGGDAGPVTDEHRAHIRQLLRGL